MACDFQGKSLSIIRPFDHPPYLIVLLVAYTGSTIGKILQIDFHSRMVK